MFLSLLWYHTWCALQTRCFLSRHIVHHPPHHDVFERPLGNKFLAADLCGQLDAFGLCTIVTWPRPNVAVELVWRS